MLPRRSHRGWPWLKVRPGHGGLPTQGSRGRRGVWETTWTRPLKSETALSREGSREKGPCASQAGGAENRWVFCNSHHCSCTFPASGPPSRAHQVLPSSPQKPKALGQRWGALGGQGPCALTLGFAPPARLGWCLASEATCAAASPVPASGPGLGQLCDNNELSFVTRPRQKCVLPPLPEDSGGQVGVSTLP